MEPISYKFVGHKYDSTLDVAEIAKRVRAEIKAAIAEGSLPAFKCSVSISRFSGGQSLRVVIKEVPPGFPIWKKNGELKRITVTNPGSTSHEYGSLAREMVEALDTLEMIREAYNREERDFATDYQYTNFHGGVSLDHKLVKRTLT